MAGFQPTEEQQLIRDTVATFAREQIRPVAREADESGQIPASLIQQVWELGLIQSTIPEAFGGSGEPPSAITSSLVCEELAWGDLSIALHALAPRLLIQPLLTLGNETQQRILREYTDSEFLAGTAAVVEPRFAFDINELATTAAIDQGEIVLNGTKCLVPLAAEARHILVYARDGQGMTAVLVPHGTPGLTIHEREKNMGLKAIATYELTLENCRVPASARLVGSLSPLLNRARVALASLAVGVARAAFEYATAYAKERRAFGSAIAQKQAVAFMLAEMAVEIDAARLLAWEAAWKIDAGQDIPTGQLSAATREACLAKNYAANMVLKVTDNALQVLGGHGYIRDHFVELWLRNARGFATFEGMAMV
ncbi:MAG: acyl-CoA dehydrogenase [Deltaproteobacteria bacterium]|nr:acyl-CoA dehydrogenase [Deltaproteobacteria bacterium]